jgi:leucyl-tRNA synthetase
MMNMSKKPYYITTAIAYTSGKPHIGNTYEVVLADSIARFKRLEGYEVFFQTGTDEHGQKIELKAAEAQAISIEDERIVAMSEIKKAGDYIVVNGKQMLSPFTIKAIADPQKLENSMTMLGGIVEELEFFSMKVTIEKKDNIIIPKVRDDGSVLKYDLLRPKK